jgi:transposase-like protein
MEVSGLKLRNKDFTVSIDDAELKSIGYRTCKAHDPDFIKQVVEESFTMKKGYKSLAKKYGIPYGTLTSWRQRYKMEREAAKPATGLQQVVEAQRKIIDGQAALIAYQSEEIRRLQTRV